MVIRTFLFLTADDTPEGQILRELADFKKLDKKYRAIDKLSTFFSKDLRSNKLAKELFIEAG